MNSDIEKVNKIIDQIDLEFLNKMEENVFKVKEDKNELFREVTLDYGNEVKEELKEMLKENPTELVEGLVESYILEKVFNFLYEE